MFKTLTDNSTLYISSPQINNCAEVAEYLRQSHIKCHVTSNDSIVKIKDKFIIEKGCQIKFGNHHPKLINTTFWNNLQQKFKLGCAYLEVEGKYKGCIYDYFLNSVCPSK